MSAQTQAKFVSYTFAEYLNLEQTEGQRYEYAEGELVAMAGGSLSHNRLARQVGRLLDGQLPKGYEVFVADVKLEIKPEKRYYYPDLLLTCDPDDLASEYWVRSPSLVVEVLSEGTENYDLGTKWLYYQNIPSLQYCLFISQYEHWIGMYKRLEAAKVWCYEVFENLEQEIVLSNLNIRFSLAQIYENVPLGKRG